MNHGWSIDWPIDWPETKTVRIQRVSTFRSETIFTQPKTSRGTLWHQNFQNRLEGGGRRVKLKKPNPLIERRTHSRLIDWLIRGLIDWLIDWFVDWLVDWLIDSWIGWLIRWSAAWLVDCHSFFPPGIIAEHRRQSSSTTLPIRNLSTRPRPGCASSSARPIRTLSSPWPGTSRTWSTNAPWSTRKRRHTPTSRACSFWRPPPRAESTSMNSFWPSPKSSRKPSRPGRAAKARPSTSTPARARPSPAAVAAAAEETPHRRTMAARRRREIRRKILPLVWKKKSGGGGERRVQGGGERLFFFWEKSARLTSLYGTNCVTWYAPMENCVLCPLFFTLKHRRNYYCYLPNFRESSCVHFHF